MRLLVSGRRSSLYKEGDEVYRHFHDTGSFAPVPVRLDDKGVRRFQQNGTERSLCPRRAPPHLCRARDAVLASETIHEVAVRCGVKRSTAWQYVTKACESFPEVAAHVMSRLVCPELAQAAAGVDLDGSLREVMARMDARLRDDIAWRCEEDRYSQLRLFRVCLAASRTAGSDGGGAARRPDAAR